MVTSPKPQPTLRWRISSRSAQPRALRGPQLTPKAEIADPSAPTDLHPSKSTVPRPTTQGKQGLKIFPEEYEESDALSLAPPRDGGSGVDVELDRLEHMRVHVDKEQDLGAKIEDDKNEEGAQQPAVRTSVKVRPGECALILGVSS